ncbi:MAG TPA: 4Fe-4S binding protein [Burkholderiaceae bacterium]|nr:4Fe-4S binding protein [Burkholderiaceae bacterium]
MAGNALKVCNCNRTMSLDGAALGRALGREAIPIYTELCRKEVDGFTAALGASSCTVACTQEAPLFTELAAGAGASTELKFVNIREAAGWSAEGATATAKIAALLALADLPEPQPVAVSSYSSKGEVLIIGPAEAAIAWGEQLAESLSVSVLITTARGAELPAIRGYPVWSGMPRSVEGYLGKFEVEWEQINPIDLETCTRCNACIRVCPEQAIDLTYQIDLTRCKSHRACVKACGAIGAIDFGRAASTRKEQFDLVFDLSAQPLMRMPERPFGYLAPGTDPLEQAQAATRLVQMVGEFEKPRYVQYEEKLCAHSRNTKTGCTRCLDVCATDAVRSLGDKIWAHPFLCMGCGDCATTCPTGALRFAYPGVADIGTRLRKLLSVYRAAGGKDAALLLHNGSSGRALISRLARVGKGLPAHVLPIEVHSVATIGLDVVLGAIAFGASQVYALLDETGADEHGALLEQQARLADVILNGLGFGGTHWQVLRAEEPATLEAALWSSRPAATVSEPAAFHLSNRKRETLDFAIDHLVRQASSPPEQITLPAGSPFGALAIDASRCTLCKACIGACPSSALQDTEDAPKLRFIEHNCVQCGLCETTCPEKAISLVPRLLVTPAARQAVTLHEAEPFHCVRCGAPFGTRQMIDVMTGRLGAHPMFAGAALRRIQMCADCRVIDMMEAKNEISIFDVKR